MTSREELVFMGNAVTVDISREIDVFVARATTRTIGTMAGFSPTAVAELAIVASELAWNILKYAGRGELEVVAVAHAAHGAGIRLDARDGGPAFSSFTTALLDGHDDAGPLDPLLLTRRRGIGGGLGAVARLSDAVSCIDHELGKCIRVVRYLRRPRARTQGGPA